MKTFGAIVIGLLAAVFASEAIAAKKLEEARGAVSRWVAVEQAISREAIAWQEKKSLFNDLITVARQEITALKKQIAEADQATSEAEARRSELVKKRDAKRNHAHRVSVFLTGFEGRLREFRQRLPGPLKSRLEPLMLRLPADPAETTLGIAERMQTVVGIVSEIQRFDALVTVGEEMMSATDGTEREVRTLHLGLGAAYYAASDGGMAGYGVMTESGWEWRVQPELAEVVLAAIASAEGPNRDPSFANLPVNLEARSK